MTDEATQKPTAATAAAWKKAAVHYPLLPSGTRVGVRIPDLPALIEAGEIPQNLLEAALGTLGRSDSPKAPTRELIVQQREFTDRLVQLTVVDPKLSDDDVRTIPYEDKELLVEFATRTRDLDAEGEHLAGLTKSEKFRRFRGLPSGDEDVADF